MTRRSRPVNYGFVAFIGVLVLAFTVACGGTPAAAPATTAPAAATKAPAAATTAPAAPAATAPAATKPAAAATTAPAATKPAAAAPAAPAASAGGGQTPNNVAELEALLAQNVYVQAATNAGKETSTNTGKVFKAGDKVRITFSLEGLSHPYLVNQTKVAKAIADKNNAEMAIVSADDQATKQVSDVETSLARGTDALMMMPASTQGLQNVLKQYDDKKIPYFFATKGMDAVNPAGSVLANYAGEGKALGEWVVDYYNKQGKKNVKVALIAGIAGDVSSVARVGEFKLALLKSGNFQIVGEQPGQYRREASAKVMEGFLASQPDIQLVLGANDEAALGALAAIRGSGRKGIDIVGMDAQTDMFPEIQNGSVLASHTHLATAGMVAQSVIDYLQGKPIKKLQVTEGEQVVTKEMIDQKKVEPSF